MIEGQELVEAPETAIKPFNEFEVRFAEIKLALKEKTYDLTTEQGIEECEADKTLIRKVEIGIEKKRKAMGAAFLKSTKDLNASAKVCHNMVHELWEVIDKPLQVMRQIALDAEIDAREKAQAEEKAAEEKREAELAARETKVAESEAKLNEANDKIKKAAEAAQAETDRVAREEKAVKDALDKQATEAAEKIQKETDAANARAADVQHRKKYNNLALEAITAKTGDPASSLRLVKSIVEGEIPNVTMNY